MLRERQVTHGQNGLRLFHREFLQHTLHRLCSRLVLELFENCRSGEVCKEIIESDTDIFRTETNLSKLPHNGSGIRERLPAC